MEIIITLTIIAIIVIVKKKNDEKWEKSLTVEEKVRMQKLEVSLSSLNQEAKEKMPKKIKLSRLLYNLSKNLLKDEEILFFTSCTIENTVSTNTGAKTTATKGFIYVTNKKVIALNDKTSKMIVLEKINSVESGEHIANAWIIIHDNVSNMTLNNIPKKDIITLKNAINKGIENHKNISINITQTTEKDIADKIARLEALYKDGVLTEYEFNIKKLELLDKSK